ncbi:MAG: hypothetical protein AAFY56_12620 [Pseudomonadota bacterium]
MSELCVVAGPARRLWREIVDIERTLNSVENAASAAKIAAMASDLDGDESLGAGSIAFAAGVPVSTACGVDPNRAWSK